MACELIIDTVKSLTKSTLDQLKLADLLLGEIIAIAPLKIRIDERIELTESFFVIPLRLLGSFQTGDKIALLRASGGQKFYILDKVG